MNILRTRNQNGSVFAIAAGLSVDHFSVLLRRIFSPFVFASDISSRSRNLDDMRYDYESRDINGKVITALRAYEIRKFGKIRPTSKVIHIGFSTYNAVSRCFPLTALFFSRYKPTTTAHHYNTLRSVLEYARRFRYIQFNPCSDLSQKEKPKRGKKSIDFLTPDEAIAFLSAAETEPLFWKAFLNLLITTGLRRGEAVALQWGDIDPEKLTITIQRNVTIDKSSPDKIHVGPTKTGETRTVPVPPRVLALLMALKQEQQNRFKAVMMPTAYVFSSTADAYKPIYPTEPTRWQRKFTERHNLPKVSPHDLRHTAATLALESKSNLKQVQGLLGHADPSTTMKYYAGLTEEAQRQTVEGIEKLLAK